MTEVASETSQPANLSTVIAPFLPYLRRHARSLCGTQSAGDGFVAQSLEALIEDRNAMDHSLPPRVSLYRLFHALWNAANLADPDSAITPMSRQMLLLTAVEEFTVEEADQIMDIDLEEAETLLQAGRDGVEKQEAAKVMIIEDEPIIAADIKRIVTGMGHIVIGVADTHTEAVALAGEAEPALILADIQLADGSSGVEAVDEIQSETQVPVVFITAYPERLLTGDRVEPPFLITKPFRPKAVEAAIAQALFHNPASRNQLSGDHSRSTLAAQD